MSGVRRLRQAGLALLLGVLFCLLYVLLVAVLGPYLPQAFLPDAGASWYYWKLPEPSALTRATAWGGYLAHQVLIWLLIYRAQHSGLKYSTTLHPINLLALSVNALFVMLHLLQTQVWYDGLAQDVSIWSSQGSVVLLLVMVLLMENSRRGLFFGYKIRALVAPGQVVRKYHGYVFSWAVIYTFWYHPMEDTLPHLLGTFYTLLLMLQGSLFFTTRHTNRNWTVVLEALVVVHGTIVAYLLAGGPWPMFLFGFAGIFIVTQMHGLGWSKQLRWGFVLAYALAAVAVYGGREWTAFEELLRIPLIEYALVFILALLITGALKLLTGRKADPDRRLSA